MQKTLETLKTQLTLDVDVIELAADRVNSAAADVSNTVLENVADLIQNSPAIADLTQSFVQAQRNLTNEILISEALGLGIVLGADIMLNVTCPVNSAGYVAVKADSITDEELNTHCKTTTLTRNLVDLVINNEQIENACKLVLQVQALSGATSIERQVGTLMAVYVQGMCSALAIVAERNSAAVGK